MEGLFSIGGLLFVCLVVYLYLRSKNPATKLDNNGVIRHHEINTLGHAINRDDFLWMNDLFKQYFPEGECTVSNYSLSKESTGKHLLIVTTSIYFMQHYIKDGESETHELLQNGSSEIMPSIIYIERSFSDTYSMYLFRKCELRIGNEYHLFKGRLIDNVGIERLKSEFEKWLKSQKDFADQFRNGIESEKQKILALQKKYHSMLYYPSTGIEG